MSDVSAIVPTVAGGARLERLLASLAQDASSMQLIVIDNGAPDAPSVAGLEGRFADAQVIAPGQNLGYGRAVNLGARRAEGARIVTVNDDCECRSGFVEALAGAIDPGAGTVMAAGVMLDASRPSLIETAGIEVDRTLMAFDYLNGLPVDPTLAGAEPPFGPSGAAAAYDREAFLAAGGFDEAIFAYLEDVDLALRLRLAGGSCALAVEARGTHGHSSTLGSGSAAKNELMGFGRGYLLRKWGVVSPLRLAGVVVREVAICAGQAAIDRNLAGVRGRVRGWRAGEGVARPYPSEELERSATGGLVEAMTRRLRRRRGIRAARSLR